VVEQERRAGLDGLAGGELLRIARETLTQQVAPHVPGERRYELLMADNAMGIAARELEAGEAPSRAALARLEALYGEPPSEGDRSTRLVELTARLAADVRAGRFDDGPRRTEAIEHLRATALDAVRIGNPRFLQRRGFE
jgi:hypothetical protein